MCMVMTGFGSSPYLEDKRRFLLGSDVYPGRPAHIELRETHMSLVFLTPDRVYKLKKPLRLPYLDFSTLARRESTCRAELAVNRRLAADVYLGVVPLTCDKGELAIDGNGEVVDWLVVMRRLDEGQMLDRKIADGCLGEGDVERLVARLVHFYRHARPVFLTSAAHRAHWNRAIAYNHAELCRRAYDLPRGTVAYLFHIQRRFLERRGACLDRRVRGHHIVDAHGDLRPEHIWLGRPVRIIDSLEFDPALRRLDPFDEAAYLGLECKRLGAAWVDRRIRTCLVRALHDGPSRDLFAFYQCYRACLRARLAIAHLRACDVRSPEKWRPLALAYLRLGMAEARRLEVALKRPTGRRSAGPGGAGRSPLPAAAHKPARRALRAHVRS